MGFLQGLLVGAVIAAVGVAGAPVSVADPEPPAPSPSKPSSPPRPSSGPAAGSGKVSCEVLDKLQESYDNDIEAGLGGLRIVWGRWGQGIFGNRLSDSKDKLKIFSHGARYLQQIDSESHVPGLAPVVSRLQSSADDLRDSIDTLTEHVPGQWYDSGGPGGWGSYGSYSAGYDWLRNPAEGDWAALDNADDQAQALQDLITGLRSKGCV